MIIKPKSDPTDVLQVELAENDLCSVSIIVQGIGTAYVYLNVEEIYTLQRELTKTAAKIRGKLN